MMMTSKCRQMNVAMSGHIVDNAFRASEVLLASCVGTPTTLRNPMRARRTESIV